MSRREVLRISTCSNRMLAVVRAQTDGLVLQIVRGARMKRTVLLLARIRIEWVMALWPCDLTPRKSALSLMPVAQKMMFFPFARSSAIKTRSRSFSCPSSIRLLALLIVARPHHALHVAAEAFDAGGGEHGFGRTADAHDKDRCRCPAMDGRHGGGDVAVADHAQGRAGRRISATISLCRGRSSIITTTSCTRLFKRLRHERERLLDRVSQLERSIPLICMCR